MATAWGSVDPRKTSISDCWGYGMRSGSGPAGWLAAAFAEFGGTAAA